ncbi:MAG TPA: peptidase M14 [Planctomycetes bacterium]|nr:peptidase M14 [Planctomycetota bacterium]
MLLFPVVYAFLSSFAPQQAAPVTTPQAYLGRPLGRDFELADWDEVSGYYRRLAAESPCVRVESLGPTTEGRDFLLAVIASEQHMARIDEIRADSARIADPRRLAGAGAGELDELFERTPPTLFLSLGMHSTETAAPQFGMELAHLLATSQEEPYRSAREELVLLIAPCLNPDGLDRVVSWYRETVGTPYESADLLELYQHYAGHDNNRDWFMLSQPETRMVTKALYHDWFPQVYWDVHQQGTHRERLFVPAFRDPLDPNLDPGIISGIGNLGARALFDMTRDGFRGVSTGVTYDMWWNGGNRNVPVRHNIIGLLTEAASVNLASPIFLSRESLAAPRGLGEYAPSNRFPAPWPGGWWHLRDIIDYEHGFARSLLASLVREPRLWLENAYQSASRALELGGRDAPRAWILPSTNRDVAAARRLVDALLLGGVEVQVAKGSFRADGREWPAGSVVILRAQPYGQHVKDLFEVQRYPEGTPPYDVSGWTLPMLLGVRRVEVMREFDAELENVQDAQAAVAAFGDGTRSDGAWGSAANGDTWVRVFRDLTRGKPVVFRPASPDQDGACFEFSSREGGEEIESMPRVGLYAPWSGSMDEGWTRFVFDRFGVPYIGVRNEMLRAGDLSDFLDVLVLPSLSAHELDEGRAPGSVPPEFARGLDPEGAVAIEAFVRSGGKLVAIESAASWAIDLFEFPLTDLTRGEEGSDFSCPGSVLRAIPEGSGDLSAGIADSVALFFSRSAAWRLEEREDPETGDAPQPEVLLRYAPTRLLLSGWIRSPETIEGAIAWARFPHGKGSVDLFGFRPQYRGWSQGTFQLLFRSLLF